MYSIHLHVRWARENAGDETDIEEKLECTALAEGGCGVRTSEKRAVDFQNTSKTLTTKVLQDTPGERSEEKGQSTVEEPFSK